jgi:hypothetical protein
MEVGHITKTVGLVALVVAQVISPPGLQQVAQELPARVTTAVIVEPW